MTMSTHSRSAPPPAVADRRMPSVMGYLAAGAVGLAMWASLLTMVF